MGAGLFGALKKGDSMTSIETTDHSAEAVDRVMTCVRKTRANTLPMCACLRACLEETPYRDVEADLEPLTVMKTSLQTPHVLINLLVEAGGIERTAIEEESAEVAGESDLDPEDQPTDWTLKTTLAGQAVLEALEPAKMIDELCASEPAEFTAAIEATLRACEQGAKLSDVNEALGGKVEADGKSVYPEYFVSKLEAAGGLEWDGCWKTTDAGLRFLQGAGA